MSADKKEVIERLGIGGTIMGKGRVSHSVASGIKAIPQEGVSRGSQPAINTSRKDGDWEIIEDDATRSAKCSSWNVLLSSLFAQRTNCRAAFSNDGVQLLVTVKSSIS